MLSQNIVRVIEDPSDDDARGRYIEAEVERILTWRGKDRPESRLGNKGSEAALAALELVDLLKRIN